MSFVKKFQFILFSEYLIAGIPSNIGSLVSNEESYLSSFTSFILSLVTLNTSKFGFNNCLFSLSSCTLLRFLFILILARFKIYFPSLLGDIDDILLLNSGLYKCFLSSVSLSVLISFSKISLFLIEYRFL